jgi:hypothetical protein
VIEAEFGDLGSITIYIQSGDGLFVVFLALQPALNQRVAGSSPAAPTRKSIHYEVSANPRESHVRYVSEKDPITSSLTPWVSRDFILTSPPPGLA